MFDIFFDLTDMHQVVDNDEEWEAGENWIVGIDYDTVKQNIHIGSNLQNMFEELGEWNEIINTVEKKIDDEEKSGCNCVKCGDIFPYAEPNQPDGTLICYSCRNFG